VPELPVQRIADRLMIELMIEPDRGQRLTGGGFPLGGDRQQQMLCLDRGRSVRAGFVSGLLDDRVEVVVECGHRFVSASVA